jgi:uncharacterized membrane protein (UPF0127 family)
VLSGCADAEPRGSDPETANAPSVAARAPNRLGVLIGGEAFDLELALDDASRYRGLSGRASIPANGGMLFVFPAARPRRFVMRECFVPIDIAFLDDVGRIVAIHEMPIEAPRAPDESAGEYERRLPSWSSGVPARFAIEVAGGRLASLAVHPGQHLVFDFAALARRAH